MISASVAIQRPNAVMLSLQDNEMRQLNSVAQNLANASTPGYKSVIARLEEAPQTSSDGTEISFVKTAGVVRNLSEGPILKTNNPLHLALAVPGYFAVKTPEGQRYTRDGQFLIDPDGRLMSVKGYSVLNASGSEITVSGPIQDLSFSSDGTLLKKGLRMDRLGVFQFKDEQKLFLEGGNVLNSSETPEPLSQIRVIPGALEDSNVSPMNESIRMIEILRLFEQAQKITEEYDQMQKKMINASGRNC